MKRAAILIIAGLLICAGDPAPPSAFDFNYPPTPEGRQRYQGVIAGVFGPMIALAAACRLRSLHWTYSLESYVTGVVLGPIKGAGEAYATLSETEGWTAMLKYSKAEAARDFLQDSAGACDDLKNDPDLPDADRAVKIITAPVDPKHEWDAIVPVVPTKP